ncbi:MAG: metal ABC transporter substrate-binding protein [Clostridia bacterium]|nr:metal ABC transporter substrate-binding protein [Clostridia bacterium]
MILALALCLAGCRPLVSDAPKVISVYATFYPIYTLTDAVIREVPDAELHCLVQPQDGCLRNYQLSDWDLYLLAAGADAVVMGGRGLESFESALFNWGDRGPAVSAVLYNLELYNQQDAANGEQESHLSGANPHLYMSLEGAAQIIDSLYATLLSLDPDYGELYAKNAEAARARLSALLEEQRTALAPLAGRRVILMNEALIYAAQDYGLTAADWIDRESGEGMGDREIEALLERLSDAEAKVVLIERQAPQALVEALEGAGFAVARLDVMSTHREGEGFDTYLEIQRANAQSILAAFDRADGLEGED